MAAKMLSQAEKAEKTRKKVNRDINRIAAVMEKADRSTRQRITAYLDENRARAGREILSKEWGNFGRGYVLPDLKKPTESDEPTYYAIYASKPLSKPQRQCMASWLNCYFYAKEEG